MKIILTLIIVCLLSIPGYAQNKRTFNKALADSIESLIKADQIVSSPPQGEYRKWEKNRWRAFVDSTYDNHQPKLAAIYDRYGYPGEDLVGVKGSHLFWLLVQHSDRRPDFQIKMLAALKIEVDRKNASAIDFAYLTDRVNLHTGKKQVYGTQVNHRADICQVYPKPVMDSLNLNARRKAINMPPIEEYLNEASQWAFDMNKESFEARGIKGPTLYTVPKQ